MKRIVLCADDYGQAEAISKAILMLIERNRLSATSCLVTTSHWKQHAEWLKAMQPNIDIGLHLNFTEGKPVSQQYRAEYGDTFFNLSSLIKNALTRKLNSDVILAECHAQLDQFIELMGFLPDFVDGHQHVHHFPGIRDALISVYTERLQVKKSYIRLVNEKIHWTDCFCNIKKLIIYALGVNEFSRLLKKHKIPHNSSFSGIYPFRKARHYRKFFLDFLRGIHHKGLIMCHPALMSSNSADSIAKARLAEYEYLSGDSFLTDCLNNGIILGRFNQ